MLKLLPCRSFPRRRTVRYCHTSCGIFLRWALPTLFAATAVGAPPLSPVSLAARVATAAIPAGGTAQIQILLLAPASIVCGEIAMDLDPTVFGSILSADVFSVIGDQVGSASIQGQHLDVVFFSQTGGIGRLPRLLCQPGLASAEVT